MTEISTIAAVGGFSAPETTEGAVLTDALGKSQAPAELVERFRNAMEQPSANQPGIAAFPKPDALPAQPNAFPAQADVLSTEAMASAPVLFQGMPVVTPEILPMAEGAAQPGMPSETVSQPQPVVNATEKSATTAVAGETAGVSVAADIPAGTKQMAVQPQPGAAAVAGTGVSPAVISEFPVAPASGTVVSPAVISEFPAAAAPLASGESAAVPAVVPEMPSQGVVSAEPAGTTVPSGVPAAVPAESQAGIVSQPGAFVEGGRAIPAKDAAAAVVSADAPVAAESEEVSAGISRHISGKESAKPTLPKSAKSVSTVGDFGKTDDAMAGEEIPAALPAAPQVVLQAAPLAATPEIAAGMLPSVDAAGAVAAAASARTQNLVEVAEQVCDAILVSPGLVKGEGEIRLQLKADVLDGTEIRIEAKSSALAVSFQPVTSEAQYLLERHISQFEQHLAGRIHNYQISVSVRRSKQNERA